MIIEERVYLEHLSDRPWNEYKASDYSIEQWHSACLIHQHDGPPTSKGQCKLPIKTPNGAVNRNGVYAAAAALGGARGGVNASSEQKEKAARTLVRLYREMDKEPPASLMKHSMNVEEFVEHFGTKGMKWGVRKSKTSSSEPTSSANRKKRVAVVVGIGLGAAVVAGTVFAAKNQKLGMLNTFPKFQSSVKTGKTATKGVLNRSGTTKMTPELRSRALSARVNAASGSNQKVMKRVAANHLESVKATNATLKSWFTDSNTPLPKREYLDTSYWERLVG